MRSTVVLLIVLVHSAKPDCISNDLSSVSHPDEGGVNSGLVNTMLRGSFDFSVDMFKAIYQERRRENMFFSPHSIWTVLALTYFGSNGVTEQQIQQAMGLEHLKKSEAAVAFKTIQFWSYMRSLNATDFDLKIANRAYFEQTLKDQLNKDTLAIFQDDLKLVDFYKQSEAARTTINNWVENETKGNIKEFLTPDLVNSATNMALVNAAYFKGNWASKFKTKNTNGTLFYKTPTDIGFVKMMFQKGMFKFGSNEELGTLILELPYMGEGMSMFILLPPYTKDALENMVDRLTPENLREAITEMYKVDVKIGIPKFKIESEFDLQSALSTMGIETSTADLTCFSQTAPLNLGAAKHKAILEVNEDGTEAAAATAFLSFRTARPLAPAEFICDHPFLYFIKDNIGDTILFMGVMNDPGFKSE